MDAYGIPELHTELRRASDGHAIRLSMLEQQVGILERDVKDHKDMTTRMCNTLDEIRIEISGAKGFLKALTLAGAGVVLILSTLWAIKWLNIPVQSKVSWAETKK